MVRSYVFPGGFLQKKGTESSTKSFSLQSCETPTTFQSPRVSENRQGLKGYKPTNANLGEATSRAVGSSRMESLACNIWGKETRKSEKKHAPWEPHLTMIFGQFGDATNIYICSSKISGKVKKNTTS